MKSPRIFALATSLIAITLSVMPTNAAALTRSTGKNTVKYMTATADPGSITGTVIEVVSMLFSHLGHPL
jgi:hypothetical protein